MEQGTDNRLSLIISSFPITYVGSKLSTSLRLHSYTITVLHSRHASHPPDSMGGTHAARGILSYVKYKLSLNLTRQDIIPAFADCKPDASFRRLKMW
jgi:hypothetical protein